MPLHILILALAVFTAACSHRRVQVRHDPPAVDSAGLRVAMLRVLFDSLAAGVPGSGPVWIQPYHETDPDTGERRPVEPGPAEWEAIVRAFPGARRAAATDTLFLCPPGVRVRLPGQGCPIRDDGVIVRFGRIRVGPDSVETSAMLTRSRVRESGISTWAEGLGAIFRLVEGEWRLERLTTHVIT